MTACVTLGENGDMVEEGGGGWRRRGEWRRGGIRGVEEKG